MAHLYGMARESLHRPQQRLLRRCAIVAAGHGPHSGGLAHSRGLARAWRSRSCYQRPCHQRISGLTVLVRRMCAALVLLDATGDQGRRPACEGNAKVGRRLAAPRRKPLDAPLRWR